MSCCIRTVCLTALLAIVSLGCGSSAKELGTATTTPQPDQEEVKKQMEKSKEMSLEMMKKSGRPMPPDAGGEPKP